MQAIPSDLEKALIFIIEEKLLDTGLRLHVDTDLFAEGLDSMGIMQLMILIEQEYGVVVPAGEVTRDNFSTVNGMASLLRRLATNRS
jgi:acyl carrier protein